MKLLYTAGLLLAGLGLASAARAQDKTPAPIKFGQPDPADFEAQNFVADSGAAAVVLCDYGTSRFGSPAGDIRIIHDRVVRLKILKKAGYEYATAEIPLYHHDNDEEKISDVRGFTYVRGTDGKITKTKLTDAGIVLDKRTDRLSVQKLTLPAVQEGAVVEYAYTVTSNRLHDCPDWTFQRDIPTRLSEYRTSIPLVWVYKILYRGYLPLAVNEASQGFVNLLLARRVGPSGSIDAGNQGVRINTEQHRWVVRNAPAVREEPYSTTPADYVARLDLELVGQQMPDEPYRDLTESWTKKTHVLLGDLEFGEALARTSFLKEPVAPLGQQLPDPAVRAAAVRQLVMQHVKYDGSPRLLASGPLKKAWEQHQGTSADVNLLLVAALRQAGLMAEPLILSTRAHGRVSKEYPQFDQFNYVLAVVALPDGRDLLLDATEPGLPAGTLPLRCLNGEGHTVPAQEGEGRWVPLTPAARYVHFQDVKLKLDAEGTLSGLVQEEFGGYAGQAARGRLAELGEKKYIGELAGQHGNGEVPTYQFSGAADADKPLALSYALRQPASTTSPAAELFISPLAGFASRRNPFTLDERQFPVDLGMPQQETVSMLLTLPAGYVAELPKPILLALPEQGGRYVYSASSPAPGTVQLVSRLTLDKPRYSPEEYHALRELYRQMLAKQAEALVIKKGG